MSKNLEKFNQIANTLNQCKASLDALQLDLLSQIAANTAKIIELLEPQKTALDIKINAATPEEPLDKKKKSPVKKIVEESVPAQKVVEEIKQEPETESVQVPTKTELTQEKVLSILENWIVNHPDGDEAAIKELVKALKDLGNYSELPQVPSDKYEDLLRLIDEELLTQIS